MWEKSRCKRLKARSSLNILTLFGQGFFPTLKDRRGGGAKWPITITPVFQVRWSWNQVVISNGSCLPQIRKKSWWRHRYIDSMTSSSLLCIVTPATPNFSNFHRIKLKFGLGIDFSDPDFKFQLKNWIKCQDLTKKGIIHLSLVKYSLNRWSPWQQANVYT